MKVRVIIQARMGSSRLRGKSLSAINGVPLLKRVYDTVLNLNITRDIIFVTSKEIEDDPIEAYCTQFLSIKCLRGDTNDVLSRFLNASKDLDASGIIIRITADNIFYQKEICKQLLKIHIQHKNDYTGIKGLSHIACELISVAAIRESFNNKLTAFDKEHVTPYFINNPQKFKTNLINFSVFGLEKELDRLLTIDTVNDRDRIEMLITDFESSSVNFTQKNLYKWLNQNN